MTFRPSPKSSSMPALEACCLIRRAGSADVPAMAKLLEELFSIEEDFAADGDAQRKGLELLLQTPSALILAAEVGGEVVGMASCQLLVSTAEGGLSGLVEDVVVRQDLQGRGIGPRLMEALKNWALQRGATRLQLLADVNNHPALNFYANRGWQRTQLICLRLAPLSGESPFGTIR